MICICVSMTMEIVVDAASFDAELLQLNEVSPLALKIESELRRVAVRAVAFASRY